MSNRWAIPPEVEPAIRRWGELRLRWSPAGHAFVSEMYEDWQRWIKHAKSIRPDERPGLMQLQRQNFCNYVKQLLPVGVKYRSNGRACFRGVVING